MEGFVRDVTAVCIHVRVLPHQILGGIATSSSGVLPHQILGGIATSSSGVLPHQILGGIATSDPRSFHAEDARTSPRLGVIFDAISIKAR